MNHLTEIIRELDEDVIKIARAIKPEAWKRVEEYQGEIANCDYWDFIESIEAAKRVMIVLGR